MPVQRDELTYFYEELVDIQGMLLAVIGTLVISIFLAFGVWIITGVLSRWRARLTQPRDQSDASAPDIWRTSAERVAASEEDTDD